MGIIIKNALIKAYHFISLVEYYYKHLHQISFIIITKIPNIKLDSVLQISLKAINDLTGPNKLVPTLLGFGAYSKIIEQDALSFLIMFCVMAINKAIVEVWKCIISQEINDVLKIRNGPSTIFVYNLPMNLLVLVY